MFFSGAHVIFSRIEHILGHRTSFNKFRKTEIISRFVFDHSRMKLEIDYKKKTNSQLYEVKQHVTK